MITSLGQWDFMPAFGGGKIGAKKVFIVLVPGHEVGQQTIWRHLFDSEMYEIKIQDTVSFPHCTSK